MLFRSRASLDIARSQRTRATVATETTQEVVQQPVPQTITYGGMIRRSDGRSTVWLNNRPVHDGNNAEGGPTVVRRVGPDGAVTLEVPQSNTRVDLKVGQSVEVLSGSVEDSYRKVTPPSQDKPAAAGPTSKVETPKASEGERVRPTTSASTPNSR